MAYDKYLKRVVFMSKRIRVKTSKPVSLLGMIAGIVFMFSGLLMVIPSTGL